MAIFTHVVLGTNDLEKARSFYDAVLEPLGLSRLMDMEERAMWGVAPMPEFMVTKPIDGEPASSGNGSTIGFVAASSEAVDKSHAAGLAAGGTCAGEPGLRPIMPGLYAAYLRDQEGNKICVAYFGQPEAA